MKSKLYETRIKHFLATITKKVFAFLNAYIHHSYVYKNKKIILGGMDFIDLFIYKFELSNNYLLNAILDTRHKKEEENIVPTFLQLI